MPSPALSPASSLALARARPASAAPEALGGGAVWRADELARNVGATRPTGHAALDAVLDISGSRSFRIFFATYNAGLVITVGVMVWHGFIQLAGGEGGAAIAGTAGIGHILLTVGIAALMVSMPDT